MFRAVAVRSIQPTGVFGCRYGGGGPLKVGQMNLEQATLAAKNLKQNMANLDESIAKMKASLPEDSAGVEATEPTIVQSGWDSSSGMARM